MMTDKPSMSPSAVNDAARKKLRKLIWDQVRENGDAWRWFTDAPPQGVTWIDEASPIPFGVWRVVAESHTVRPTNFYDVAPATKPHNPAVAAAIAKPLDQDTRLGGMRWQP